MFLVAFSLALRERNERRQPPAERSPCTWHHTRNGPALSLASIQMETTTRHDDCMTASRDLAQARGKTFVPGMSYQVAVCAAAAAFNFCRWLCFACTHRVACTYLSCMHHRRQESAQHPQPKIQVGTGVRSYDVKAFDKNSCFPG